MSYCLNPHCPNPHNTNDGKFCRTCGSKLLLKERYRALIPLGQGGFGRTFLALDEDKPSKPRCVIKQFYPQAQGTSTVQKAVELFNQEAMRLDELGKHPQIPELLAYFTQDDRQYLVQEFIDGQNLAQELAQKRAFNETEIRQFLKDLLQVLQFCHARHVIHRDIKPENIIRRSSLNRPLKKESSLQVPLTTGSIGDIVLVDFGASKEATYTSLNKTGTSIGSPEYVAPEQIRGRAIFASDIYSLGVTCIHLLTGRSPFELYNAHNDTWIWQQYVETTVSDELSRILNKMLESIPVHRYQTVEQVLLDLNKLPSVAPTSTGAPRLTNPTLPPLSAKTALSAQPITSTPAPNSTVVSSANNQIDKELEEIRNTFVGGGSPKNSGSNNNEVPSPKSPSSTSKSVIDDELEEIKAKYNS
jgi:serine/threonine protein kinase